MCNPVLALPHSPKPQFCFLYLVSPIKILLLKRGQQNFLCSATFLTVSMFLPISLLLCGHLLLRISSLHLCVSENFTSILCFRFHSHISADAQTKLSTVCLRVFIRFHFPDKGPLPPPPPLPRLGQVLGANIS